MSTHALAPRVPLVEEAEKAARILREHAYVRVAARAEPDAVCAATLLAHAMRREGIDFHATFLARLDGSAHQGLVEERNEALILIGLGGDAAVSAPPGRIIVLDRAEDGPDGEARLVDAASLGALAQLVAGALAPRHADLALLAVAGATTRRRAEPLDERVLAQAAEAGVVQREASLALRGETLVSALGQMDEPFMPGLTGRARSAKKLVAQLRLVAEAPPDALSRDEAERLGSALALHLLQARASDAALDALFRARVRGLKGPHTGVDAADLALRAEAGVAAGQPGLAFAALWGDEASGGQLVQAVAALREELVAALLKAERDARREGALIVIDAPRPGLCAPLADRAALSFPDGVLVARAEGELAVRARRDVAASARAAAAACGGRAWGRGPSAHASVPAAEEGRFLKMLSEALS